MADQPTITQADVDSLGQKLAQFKQTLTEGEIAAMAVVFRSGVPQGEDVAGYSFGGYGAGGSQATPFILNTSPIQNVFPDPAGVPITPDPHGKRS